MHEIKKFLRTVDLFGITFTFRYKNKEKYQTSLGGLFNIFFIILTLTLGIYYFIPFINRKNYSIVYYTMNLSATKVINFQESKSNFAIGLTCEGNPNEKIPFTDLLRLESRYSKYIKSSNGSFVREREVLKTHSCTYADFYNKYDSQVDYLGLQRYQCIDDNNYSIEGVYADQIFSYFDFSVTAMDNSTKILNELDRFLFQNDCKFNLVYTDIIIDLDNYKNPTTQFLNNIFIQLNPTLLVKRNMYFMNQYFSDDDYLIWIFTENDESKVLALYSRYEEYYLYKGFNRSQTLVDDYLAYARIFMRSDLRKTDIKRKYQKLMEFYADASSLLIALYDVLYIIFGFINNFYAHHSLAKRLFFFKELEDHNFHIFEKNKEIKELISKISENNIDNDDKYPNELNNTNSNNDNKEEGKKSEIRIYNKKKPILNKQISRNQRYISNLGKEVFIKKLSGLNSLKRKNKKLESIKQQKSQYIKLELSKKNDLSSNIRNEELKDIEYNIIKSKEEKINYNFNIFEIIISQIFSCCMTKKLKLKNNLNKKADDILCQKMDIILYIRNMILFDILNKTVLDNNKKTIINFLCRPIITNDKKSDNEFEKFYKNYNESDFEQLYEQLPELIRNSKENRENKLISLSYEHLKDLI